MVLPTSAISARGGREGLKSHSDGHLGPSLQCPTLLPFKLHSYCSAFHAEMLQQLRHAGFADPPTHQEQQRKAPFCMVVDAAKQQPVLSILQPACAQLLFCQLQLYVLAASSFNDTSCAKLTPPVTLSHDWKAASHFLQRFVPDIYLGVIMTFTFLSAKCQPHQVSQAARLTFQDALRMR